jgi:hypothetical protein
MAKPNKTPKNNAFLNSFQQAVSDEDKDLITLTRQRFKDTVVAWADVRRDALDDQRFYAGAQYDQSYAASNRAGGGAPKITQNQLPNMVQQVENNIRQQNISITVHATDEQGSEEDAKVLQGMIRHIEEISNSKQAYIWAAGSHGALVTGFGFIKLETDWVGKQTFDQEIYIRGVKDPMKILPDFLACKPDFSDARYWFEFEEYGKDEFKTKYGESALAGGTFSDWGGVGQVVGQEWVKPNSITVAKYWYKEVEVRHFCAFADGTMGYIDDFGAKLNSKGEVEIVDQDLYDAEYPRVEMDPEEKRLALAAMEALHAEGSPEAEYPVTEDMVPFEKLAGVLRWREEVIEHVHWIITNGIEVLDKDEWHDSEFPFVAVIGKDMVVDGKRIIQGIIRDAKDSQKMVNYLSSQLIGRVNAANKSPWIAALESIPPEHRDDWEKSHLTPKALLLFNARDPDGQPLPSPTRGDNAEPAIQAFMAGIQEFNQAIKSTIGIHEAGVGQTVGERQSGAAIMTLAQQGMMNNLHVSDNLVMSIKRLGCLILRLIPKVYDTQRAIRIINPDDSAEIVKINQIFTEGNQQKHFDIAGAGGYDVVIDTGPGFATKKAEQAEQILKFGAANPAMMPVIMDLIAKTSDWDTGGAIAERVQLWQSANLPYLHTDDGQQPLPPQARVAMGKLQQQLKEAQTHINTLQQAYQQEKYKNDTSAVEQAGKLRQIQIQGMYDLALKKMDLLQQTQGSKDKLALEATKIQLKHINDKQKLHLSALQASDAAQNRNDTALYTQLQTLIDQAADQGISADQSGAPPAAPAGPAGPQGAPPAQ